MAKKATSKKPPIVTRDPAALERLARRKLIRRANAHEREIRKLARQLSIAVNNNQHELINLAEQLAGRFGCIVIPAATMRDKETNLRTLEDQIAAQRLTIAELQAALDPMGVR